MIIKFFVIKLVVLLFFNNENNRLGLSHMKEFVTVYTT